MTTTVLKKQSSLLSSQDSKCFLFVADGSPCLQGIGNVADVSLFFDVDGKSTSPDKQWQQMVVNDICDAMQVRSDYLGFLDHWPRQEFLSKGSFDQLVQRPDHHSVWWTSSCTMQNSNSKMYRQFTSLWVLDRILDRYAPDELVVYTKHNEVAWAIAQRCDLEGRACTFLEGSARPQKTIIESQRKWLVKTLLRVPVLPIRLLLRSGIVRLTTSRPRVPDDATQPTVVFASRFMRYFDVRSTPVRLLFWKEICASLAKQAKNIHQIFLVRIVGEMDGQRSVGNMYHSGWRLLQNLPGSLPIKDRYPETLNWLATLPHYLRTLFRYYKIENTIEFSGSFRFAGFDVRQFFLSDLRSSVAGLPRWEQTVAGSARALQQCGNVHAMVAASEMYRIGMIHISAAQRCGIPTIGIQHGTIYPFHFHYTPPPGRITGAPMPDYFAVYGQFAKETLSTFGAYPEDRIWITGGPRFDHLVNDRIDQAEARRNLSLPLQQKIVLVTTQTFPWFPKVVESVFSALVDRSDCFVCVKVHPKPSALPVSYYADMAAKIGFNKVRFYKNGFEELLAACDVLVSSSSTTMFEAILSDKLTICASFDGQEGHYPYAQDGGSLPARTDAEMKQALYSVLDSPSKTILRRREFLDRHAGPTTNGNASDSLAKKIIQIVTPDQ